MKTRIVELVGVRKSYGSLAAVKETTLHFNSNEMTCLIGPSGSGKTTLLQLIAAIIPVDSGTVSRFGEELDYHRRWPNDSRVGYVFQENRLFPHLSAIENCLLALEHVAKLNRHAAERRAFELFEKLHIVDIAGKFPHHISGGQKQRVAIARTLALEPSLLLLDEVTSSLDPENVANLLDVIGSFHSETGCTCIFSTHHIGFTRTFAHRILFMTGGRIIEDRKPHEFFELKGNPAIDSFLQSLKKIS